jgi:hypothetical protein
MDALTAQSIRGLRSRLESFRPRGLVPALMAEFRLDAPDEERRPLAAFEGALHSGSLYQMGDGAKASRTTWLVGDPALIREFRDFCTDAARAALPAIHAAGYAVGLGAPNPQESWLWAMFELAALRLPGTYLRLADNDVLRACAPEITITESMLRSIDSGDPLFPFAAAAGQTRYWRLASAVEASVAALDIAQLGPETGAVAPRPQPVTTINVRRRSTRKIDVDGALGKLETKLRKELIRELGSEPAADAALVDRLYSLSAESLVPMLRGVGCKTSAKTIYRPGNSQKYESWVRYRRPGAAATTHADVGPAHSASELDGQDSDEDGGGDPTCRLESGRRPRASDAAEDAVYSGHLSRRTGGRGIARIGKTAAEKAAEDAADRFAREAGVDLPPAE